MIINTSQGDIEVIGDVQEFKISIDPRNLEFITTLLSSNLYSDPEQSFIREIVSNAWDSHVEAGTTKDPVIIKFTKDSVTIRDYGTGLSPERFQEVYRNIGSSTKRESNDYIGCFGIGHLSPFACSDTVYITSYYDGTAYYYVGTKSNNTILYHKLNESPTDERNGVEVTIRNVKDITPYNKALQFITFFPNVYIHGSSIADILNNTKLKRFKYFAASSIFTQNKLLLGNVLYPCNKYHLSYDARDFIDNILYTGIVIKFDVGEIDITPNRESIIYNSKVIEKIENRIKEAKKELEDIIISKIPVDYDDIVEYYKVLTTPIFYDPILDEFGKSHAYRVTPSMINNIISITYKGVPIDKSNIDGIGTILRLSLPNFKGVIDGDKIYTKKLPYRICDREQIKTSSVVILNRDSRLFQAVKEYLRDKYNGYSVMTDISKGEFEQYLKDELGHCLGLTKEHYDLIIGGIYESLMKRAKKLNLDNDKDFLTFKEQLSNDKKRGVIRERKTILHIFRSCVWRDSRTFKDFTEAINYIKSLKTGIILSNMEGDDSLLYNLANVKGYTYIKARKDIVEDIKSLNLSCIVDFDWLVCKDRTLSIVKAILKYFPNGNIEVPSTLYGSIPVDKIKEFHYLVHTYNKYTSDYTYRGIVRRLTELQEDPYTEYLCITLKNYLDKYNEAKELATECVAANELLINTIILKTKAYRISSSAYDKIKNNKLIKVLCRK